MATDQDSQTSHRALRLIKSRNAIQQKYLQQLHTTPGVKMVIPVELQDREITGQDGLLHFAAMLLQRSNLTFNDVSSSRKMPTKSAFEGGAQAGRGQLYPELDFEAMRPKVFPVGLSVEVYGLSKTPQYNGAVGVVRSYDEKTERYFDLLY